MHEPQLECEYCRTRKPYSELERRNERLVCRDRQACDAADEQQHRANIAELRRRQREGDELTEAEKQELTL